MMLIYARLSIILSLIFLSCLFPSQLLSQQWNWTATGGSLADEELYGMSQDAFGNTVIVGTFRDEASFGSATLPHVNSDDVEAFVVKYDSSGQVLWARKIGGDHYDRIIDVDIDQTGNIYLTGRFKGDLQFGSITLTASQILRDDGFIAKYDANGTVQWARQLTCRSKDSWVYPLGIETDAQGNSIIAGHFRHYIDLHDGSYIHTRADDQGIFTIKYDSQGAIVWVREPYNRRDPLMTQFIMNGNGEFFLSGRINDNQGMTQAIVEKYNPFGTLVWSRSIRLDGDDYYSVPKIATDRYSGKCWVTGYAVNNLLIDSKNLGYVESGASGKPHYLALFGASGTLEWTQVYDMFSSYDFFSTLIVDEEGLLFAGGSFADSLRLAEKTLFPEHAGEEAFIMGLDPQGSPLWIHTSPGPSTDVVSHLQLDAQGNLMAAGTFASQIFFDNQSVYAGESDVFVGKVTNLPKNTSTSISSSFNMSMKAFPNPCVDQLQLHFPPNPSSSALVSLYSMHGQVVQEIQLNSHQLQTGRVGLNLASIPTGVYQATIRCKNGDIGRILFQRSR